MWPLLITSVIGLMVVIERMLFIAEEKSKRRPELVETVLRRVEAGDVKGAIAAAGKSEDYIVRTVVYGLTHDADGSLSDALFHAAGKELKRYNQRLFILDTIITLAPLLGLLGTVTGMIRSFGLLGGRELDAPAAITGGIAEALVATAFGLSIAIFALIPYNFFNSLAEEARHELEDISTRVELLLRKSREARENTFARK